jgi:hypothetical protein
MRHTFRFNVAGKGYVLVSGEELSDGYREFPLDRVSQGISQNYLQAQKRIDTVIAKENISRWYLSIANLYANEKPTIAYGCLLLTEDDQGRQGINFIHAVEVPDDLRIDEVLICIIKLLSQENIKEISKALSDLAKGFTSIDYVVDFLTSHFIDPQYYSVDLFDDQNTVIHKIEHDCGGSAPAWLAMTISHLNIPLPWEIYEHYSSIRRLETVSSLHSSKEYLLSSFLHQMIFRNIFSEPYVSASKSQEVISKKNKPKNTNKLIQGAELKTLPDSSRSKDSQSKNTFDSENQKNQLEESSSSQKYYSSPSSLGTIYATFDGLYDNKLYLLAKLNSKQYIVCEKNFLSFSSNNYLVFDVEISYLFGVFKKRISLSILIKNLQEKQIQNIENFGRMLIHGKEINVNKKHY